MELSGEIISAVETISKYSVLKNIEERGAYAIGDVTTSFYDQLNDKEKKICDLFTEYSNLFFEELKNVLDKKK